MKLDLMCAVQFFFVLIKQISEAGSLAAFLQEPNFSRFLRFHFFPGLVLSKNSSGICLSTENKHPVYIQTHI